MNKTEWIEKCQHWKNKWPVYNEEYNDSKKDLNLYSVVEEVNKCSKYNDVFMCDAGSMSYICPVTLKIKDNQQLISSPAQADMGWVLPASIGVALYGFNRVIVFVGDGSFMSNIQELATVRYHNLNIKFIVLNNGGYLSIRNTQLKFFERRIFGTGYDNGLWFPKLSDVANTFEIKYDTINNYNKLNHMSNLLNEDIVGPHIIECLCDIDQEIIPAQALKNGKQCGLHDMYPFLSEKELNEEMIISI